MSDTVFNELGKWSKTNTFIAPALMYECKLGGCALAVLLYMIGEHDRAIFNCKEPKGVTLSYDKLAKMLGCSKWTVRTAIETLVYERLIICVNSKERKGRAMLQYKINVGMLQKIVSDFLKRNAECADAKIT